MAVIYNILLTILTCLFLSGLSWFLINKLERVMQAKNERQHSVRLSNQGNVLSRYLLTVDSTEPGLNFKAQIKGAPKTEVRSNKIESVPVSQIQGGSTETEAEPLGQGARNSLRTASGFSQGLVTFLGSIGRVLPGGVGKIFYDQSGEIRRLQARAGQVDYIKKKAQRNLNLVSKNGNHKGNEIAEPLKADMTEADPKAAVQLQTEPVSPGESMEMILRFIFSNRRNPAGSYPYRIISQQIPLESLDRTPPPVSYTGTVVFPQTQSWAYLFPALLKILMVFTALLVFVIIFLLIWF